MPKQIDIKTLIGKTFTSIGVKGNQVSFSNSEELFVLIVDHSANDWLYGTIEALIGKPITYANASFGKTMGFFEIGSGQPYENHITIWSDIAIQGDTCSMRSKLYDYSE